MDTANNATPAEKVRVLMVPAKPQAVREARHRLHALLRDWASPVDWDTAILLFSEVLTNAVLHGTNPATLAPAEIRVIVRQSPDGLCIEVHDHGGGEPACAHTEQDWAAESGRGLDLVEFLADSWGTKHEGQGKSVYFLLAAEPVATHRDEAVRGTGPHTARGAGHNDARRPPPPVADSVLRSRDATSAETGLAGKPVGAP